MSHWAEERTILRAVVGSTAHGLALEGTDDHDEMAVCIEPIEYVVGLQNFEQYIFRTAEERARHDPEADQRYQGKTPPSQPGDLDLVVYSLRKFVKLAAAGNPSILVLLFAAPLKTTEWGAALLRQRDMFASREAGKRFLGYLKAQKERMLGTRGQMRVTRTELVAKYGYDTKYAAHAVRLGWQGVEYLETGNLTLPMAPEHRRELLALRRGEWSFERVIDEIEAIENLLKESLDDSPLPKRPDLRSIDRFLVEAYGNTWDLDASPQFTAGMES